MYFLIDSFIFIWLTTTFIYKQLSMFYKTKYFNLTLITDLKYSWDIIVYFAYWSSLFTDNSVNDISDECI